MPADQILPVPDTQATGQGAPGSVPATPALLISADAAGPMCGRSEASWWRDHAAGRIPAPIKFPGRTLWSVRELEDWIAAGAPDRKTWEALKSARKGGRR